MTAASGGPRRLLRRLRRQATRPTATAIPAKRRPLLRQGRPHEPAESQENAVHRKLRFPTAGHHLPFSLSLEVTASRREGWSFCELARGVGRLARGRRRQFLEAWLARSWEGADILPRSPWTRDRALTALSSRNSTPCSENTIRQRRRLVGPRPLRESEILQA
jgi:hypothetical protein